MRRTMIGLAGAGALAIGGGANAGFAGFELINMGDLGAGAPSFRVYLLFDHPLDQLLAVHGDEDFRPLIFDSGSPLIQNNLFEGLQVFDDLPGPADLGGDSWVVLGNPDTHDTRFSPNFLGGDGMESVIKGRHFEHLDNGGWFDNNPGTPELPDENLRILIAQFTVEYPSGRFPFAFQATVSYNLEGGELNSAGFGFPGPGGLGLLVIAGVLGGRRRRSA